MTRIVLVSGKGGVGKTTVAAATAVATAGRGHRSLVMSFDVAHSLADSFNLERQLFDQNKGLPVRVADNLDLQEIDLQEEIERNWGPLREFVASVLTATGIGSVVADEIAIIPGMEDVVTLMYLNDYAKANRYDTIVVDCPPTGESIRFVSITATLEWYMRKRFSRDRTFMKVARPFAKRLSGMPVPDDEVYDTLRQLFSRIEGIDKLLLDPQVTSVRLVTNPEKMVIRETQRAYMYFNLYGMNVDQVIINRILSEGAGYYASWAETQARYADDIRSYFHPVPVISLPLFAYEIIGLDRLTEVASALYGQDDPTQVYVKKPPFEFSKEGSEYLLEIALPFVQKEALDINRRDDDLIVRIGSFMRHVPLPRAVAGLRTKDATIRDDRLTLRFAEEDPNGRGSG